MEVRVNLRRSSTAGAVLAACVFSIAVGAAMAATVPRAVLAKKADDGLSR